MKIGEPQTKMFIIVSGKVEKKKGWKTTVLARGEISGLLHFFQQDPSYGTLTVRTCLFRAIAHAQDGRKRAIFFFFFFH
jgi:hypothetical protein